MGFTNLYRPSFTKIALLITGLLKTGAWAQKPWPNQPLNWTMDCQAAFGKSKGLFVAEPILKHPNPEKLFVIQVDASNVDMRAVLLQHNKERKLQHSLSHKLNETER